MAVKEYKYNSTEKLSEHFKVSEFRCKCNKTHNTKIDSDLIDLLEKLRSKLNAKACIIYSGYRCPTHDRNVRGSGSGPHTQGQGVDCYFIAKNGSRISSKEVCLALEDMGHKYGIGYRCGGGSNSSGQTHIDVKKRKWYGDESKSMSKSCCTSFYNYFGLKKNEIEVFKKSNYRGTYPKLPSRGYFQNKDRGSEVKNLQSLLNWLNNAKLNVDGIIGPLTISEVKKFQKSNKLSVDGLFGKKSLDKAKTIQK